MTRFKKVLSLLLSLVLLFQMLPFSVFAEEDETSYEQISSTDLPDAVAADEIAILGEETSLREEFTKQYTLENGAITGETLVTAEYYGYDAMDRLTRIVVTDGTNLISDIAWSYDADQNVTAITTRVNNGGVLRTDTYACTYDAWGNTLTADGALAASNPIRYQGYYYDTETNLYYLQSRYYDPAVGRFINADNYATTYKTSTGANMFAYCMNSPVKGKDDGGDIGWNIVVGAIVGAVVGAATTAIQTYKETGKVDVGKTIISGIVGAVSGGFAASSLGMITQAAISAGATFAGNIATQKLCEGKTWNNIDLKTAAHNGALAGGLSLVGSALGSVTSAFHSMKGNSLLAAGRDKMLTGYARRAVGQSHSKLIAQGRNLVSAGISYIKSGRAISSVTGTLLTWGAYQEYSRG